MVGVGVCCRPDRLATSGSGTVFEDTVAVEVVTMELTETEVVVEVVGLTFPLILLRALSVRIGCFDFEITFGSSSSDLAFEATTVAPLTFLALAGVVVPFLFSVTLAFFVAAVDDPDVTEWLLSIEIRLMSDLSDLVEESVSRRLRFPPLPISSSI